MNFMMQLWNRLRAGERMHVPADQISSPTYAPDLVQAIAELVEQDASGIYNVAGPDITDRYNFAIQAAQALGLPSSLIEPVDTPSLKQKAKRPLKAGLSIGKLASEIDFQMKGINAGVADFLIQTQKPIR
jgi:dTDP-4-dehydrorhamnose reductase